MTDKIKKAFDGIHAENGIKENTLRYLHTEMQKRGRAKRSPARRFTAAFACIAVFLTGLLSYGLYAAPITYLDVDVNPSVGLALNRFDRVVGAYAYNEDGEAVLSGLSIRNKSYMDALELLLEAIDQKGYIAEDGLVSVTLQTDNADKERALLMGAETGISGAMHSHRQGTRVSVFPVSADTRSAAHKENLTPARYLAIQDLMEVDPTASIESCRSHSISEIEELTRQHHSMRQGNGRHGGGGHHGEA